MTDEYWLPPPTVGSCTVETRQAGGPNIALPAGGKARQGRRCTPRRRTRHGCCCHTRTSWTPSCWGVIGRPLRHCARTPDWPGCSPWHNPVYSTCPNPAARCSPTPPAVPAALKSSSPSHQPGVCGVAVGCVRCCGCASAERAGGEHPTVHPDGFTGDPGGGI